jgi:hypothetical protein
MDRTGATRASALLAALLACSLNARAQRPDLGGAWVVVTDSAAARPAVATTGDAAFRRGDAGSGWGSPLTITQQPTGLTIQYQPFSSYDLQPPLQLRFALDGSSSTNTVMLGHSAVVLRSSAVWVSDTLVITMRYPVPLGADARTADVQVRQSLHLESPTTLVIETTRSGILEAPTTSSRSTWTRR